METTAANRVKKYLSDKGLSKSEFYQAAGLSNGFLDKTNNIGSDKIEKILKAYPDLNVMWLITGEGEMILQAQLQAHLQAQSEKTPFLNTKGYKLIEKNQVVSEPVESYKKKYLPLIPIDAVAGVGAGELVIQETDIEQRYIIPEFNKADYLIRVKGSSMFPKYYPGDILACLRVDKTRFIQWNKAHVLDSTQGVLVKRILKGDSKDKWLLRSDNPAYPDIDVQPDVDIRHISLVIGVIRLE